MFLFTGNFKTAPSHLFDIRIESILYAGIDDVQSYKKCSVSATVKNFSEKRVEWL